MKFYLYGLLVLTFPFGTNSFSQTNIKEQLKIVVQNCNTTKFDSINYSALELQSVNTYDFIGLNTIQSLDSLMVFVAIQKQSKGATFDANIKPYLEEKLIKWNKTTLDFTDEEDLIYESLINVLKYENAIPIVKIFEEFIVNNYKDQTQMANILLVMSYIKYVCFYLLIEVSNPLIAYTNHCFVADLKSYNLLNWKVFALNPGALLLWIMAACAWDYK